MKSRKHVEDDERFENGEPIPTEGTPIDPELLRKVVQFRRAPEPEVGDPWPNDAEPHSAEPDNTNADPQTSHQQHPHDDAGKPLDRLWRTLDTWGALSQEPPPRRWLLTRPDDETNGMASPIGVLQLGKVGLLIGAGGAGKTMLLIALALAVATGRRWLDLFGVAHPGRVLLALGEEDVEEVWRRCFAVARAMRLTDEQVLVAAQNIVALPLAGVPVALVEAEGGNTRATEMLHEVRERMRSQEWRLIIFDPLSRFAGADTEKDNTAATRFVQAVESLVSVPGSPAVIIGHHTNKLSRTEGTKASASNARGSSAITDGARWVAELESRGDDGAKLTITKSNYSLCGAPVELVRDHARGGYLRAATSEEARQRRDASQADEDKRTEERLQRMDEEVLAALVARPGLSKTQLKDVVTGRGQDVGRSVERLMRSGRIRPSATVKHGFEAVAGGSE